MPRFRAGFPPSRLCHLYQRKGCKQHLVQALAEAAAGAVPPCALLPTLRAKETGPSATDLVMEVLKTVAGNEHDSSNGPGGTKSKKGILGNKTDGYSGGRPIRGKGEVLVVDGM